jgi:hypothetical protein
MISKTSLIQQLVNNAGVAPEDFETTPEGIEMTMAVK